MLGKLSHVLFSSLFILIWSSCNNANCPAQSGVMFTKSGCCTSNNCTADCTGVAVTCADGYTGTATTANCTVNNTWSIDVTAICTRVCPTPTGSTATASCCTNNVCIIGCNNVTISCMAAYSGDDVTANCQADGNWSVANVTNTCTADCPTQTGVTFNKSSCCAANSCDVGCTGVAITCAPGYSGNTTTANCGSNSAWNKNITTICIKETNTAATTTATNTTSTATNTTTATISGEESTIAATTSGAGGASWTKIITLFGSMIVSSTRMLIF